MGSAGTGVLQVAVGTQGTFTKTTKIAALHVPKQLKLSSGVQGSQSQLLLQLLTAWQQPMRSWLAESKGARVFTRVAVVTGLVVVAIHYNQHQERQVCCLLIQRIEQL